LPKKERVSGGAGLFPADMAAARKTIWLAPKVDGKEAP